MADSSSVDTLEYRSKPSPEGGQQGCAFVAMTLAGPICFVIFYLIAMMIAAGGESKALVGLFLLLSAMGPVGGLASSVVGIIRRSKGFIFFLVGGRINALIVCLLLIVIVHSFLNRP
ncbi:MAG TPA: hypothetical protein VGN88_00300 [Phycisphaerae bacterium]|jgi:hypothetical protein